MGTQKKAWQMRRRLRIDGMSKGQDETTQDSLTSSARTVKQTFLNHRETQQCREEMPNIVEKLAFANLHTDFLSYVRNDQAELTRTHLR